MILVFPNFDTFQLVLTGGFVPTELVLAKAAVAFDAAGRLSVETSGKLTKKSSTELTRLGVTASKRHVGETEPVSCWLQILPATRDAAPPQLSTQAVVLFELESADDLPTIVSEMLRLGNDRQQVRWIEDDASRRVLLRVVGPPYYTLLRAIDRTASGTVGAVYAYVEQAPRVWVQLGYSHAMAAKLQMPDDQLVLIREPRHWTYLAEEPYQDVYEVLQFQLPATTTEWTESPVTEKLQVPLKLVPGNAADVPELWVLRGAAADQLDAFVRDADDRLTQRLKFAVATDASGRTMIVLRVTTSKLAPPTLALAGAIGFKPYFKLPNLYIPSGSRLHPTLRRDAVRTLLADNPDQLVWLFPGESGTFTPEAIPEDAFRPLEDWVEYVIETNQAPLAAWVASTKFDFESFVCSDAQDRKPKDPDDAPGKGRKKSKDDELSSATKPTKKTDPGSTATEPTNLAASPIEVKPPSEWKVRRDELEKQFLDVQGPLNAPERVALWPELAKANAGLSAADEAALCWANAIWEPSQPVREFVEGWVRSEFPNLALPVPADEFDRRLALTDPTPAESRQFAALLLWAIHQDPLPAWLKPRLAAAQQWFERVEHKLPIRIVWLTASRLATLAGPDTLGLARVRDRLLNRLLEEGMKPERDLPSFLRYAGVKDSERMREVREQIVRIQQSVQDWLRTSLAFTDKALPSDTEATLGYADLMFAYGLTVLGEKERADASIAMAKRILLSYSQSTAKGLASNFLTRALQYRIQQVGDKSGSNAALLPPDLHDEYVELGKSENKHLERAQKDAYFAISRFRQQSRILEPHERIDPYLKQTAIKPLHKALADLFDIRDPGILAKRIREYYATAAGEPVTETTRFQVLLCGLLLAPRVGEQFAKELFQYVPRAFEFIRKGTFVDRDLVDGPGRLFQTAMILAANYDAKDQVQSLVRLYLDVIESKAEDQRFVLGTIVTGSMLRRLRKFGLRDDVQLLLKQLQTLLTSGRSLVELKAKYAAKPDAWSRALQSLLNLAAGWLASGVSDQVQPTLDLARDELLASKTVFQPKDYTPLAQAYVAALGQWSAESALSRIQELFERMDPTRIKNGFTTAAYYSRFHLNLVEETVLALVSDDFALGPAGRRWLDEDEYLVRKRVHADFDRVRVHGGA